MRWSARSAAARRCWTGRSAPVGRGQRRSSSESARRRWTLQIIAEVGASAATFPSPKHLASWMGACPGTEESAGKNYSHRCPKGNRQMRRVLNQAANAAVKAKGTIFAIVYRRLVPRLGHGQAIGAITHRLCRLIWKILHQGVRYEERGPAVSHEAKKVRARKMIRELRTLGYRVELLHAHSNSPA
jgi:transposase